MPYANPEDKRKANARAFEKALALGKPWALKQAARKPRPPKAIRIPWPRKANCTICHQEFDAKGPRHICCSETCQRDRHAITELRRPYPRLRPALVTPEGRARKRKRAAVYRNENREVLRAKDREIKRRIREERPDEIRALKRVYKSRRAVAEAIVAMNRGI